MKSAWEEALSCCQSGQLWKSEMFYVYSLFCIFTLFIIIFIVIMVLVSAHPFLPPLHKKLQEQTVQSITSTNISCSMKVVKWFQQPNVKHGHKKLSLGVEGYLRPQWTAENRFVREFMTLIRSLIPEFNWSWFFRLDQVMMCKGDWDSTWKEHQVEDLKLVSSELSEITLQYWYHSDENVMLLKTNFDKLQELAKKKKIL